MVPSAIRILASVLLVHCCCSQKLEETFSPRVVFDGEVGHRDERCPLINPKVAKLLPHEDECTSYYICESGFAILRECPDNLHFNPKKFVCDFAGRAGCELEQSPSRLLTEPGFEHPDCPAKNPKKPILLPDKSDCGRFFICDGGVAHPKTCQAGLHFNPKFQVCDFPRNVDCGTGDDDTSSTVDEKSSCPVSKSGSPTYFPHPTDCDKFYVCEDSRTHVQQCRPGLHFNARLNVCDFPQDGQCSDVKGKSGKEGGEKEETGFPSPFCPLINGEFPIFYRHPTNCSVYFMCGNGLAYRFTCPARLYFDERKKVCDLPYRVRCQFQKSSKSVKDLGKKNARTMK